MDRQDNDLNAVYKIVRNNKDYTIFELNNNYRGNSLPQTVSSLITFNSKEKIPNEKTLLTLAQSNPHNNFLNDEFSLYLDAEAQAKKDGNFEKFHDKVSLQQQSKLLYFRLRTKTMHLNQINNFHEAALETYQQTNLPNPLIIEHLKISKNK